MSLSTIVVPPFVSRLYNNPCQLFGVCTGLTSNSASQRKIFPDDALRYFESNSLRLMKSTALLSAKDAKEPLNGRIHRTRKINGPKFVGYIWWAEESLLKINLQRFAVCIAERGATKGGPLTQLLVITTQPAAEKSSSTQSPRTHQQSKLAQFLPCLLFLLLLPHRYCFGGNSITK